MTAILTSSQVWSLPCRLHLINVCGFGSGNKKKPKIPGTGTFLQVCGSGYGSGSSILTRSGYGAGSTKSLNPDTKKIRIRIRIYNRTFEDKFLFLSFKNSIKSHRC
jgi:hypothetical protein